MKVYRGFYENIEFFIKNDQFVFFVFFVGGVFLGPSEGFGRGFGLIRMKK